MGLDDFASGSVEDNDEGSDDSNESQSLTNKIQSTSSTQDTSGGRCPICGEKGEETDHWYYRCKTPHEECSIITFIRPREKKD